MISGRCWRRPEPEGLPLWAALIEEYGTYVIVALVLTWCWL